ncbi:alginate lyase family protein [uncultured Kriegella sp.]|uniref:alginate lyase family protein n=1 Tax=uncultured Kriegella sp. TaxID=1798910 RepID=UPI0030DA6B55
MIRSLIKSVFISVTLLFCAPCKSQNKVSDFDLFQIERNRVVDRAREFATLEPITVTHDYSERSAGTLHDFYSEGDYWWPDPQNPDGPYIRKDGLTNPDNFTAHRRAMIRLSQISGALASAYLVTGDKAYVKQLLPHLQAWFVNEDTKMNPNLLYAQAIQGIVTGRGIGIIDTIHLLEVVLAVQAIEDAKVISVGEMVEIRKWFSDYLEWITTHPYGMKERDNGNNHSVCWAMQVAVFADFVGDAQQKEFARNFYKETLLPDQMDDRGAFPLELARTKPYGYSLFVLDGMAALCQVLSTKHENLFTYVTPDGKSMIKGLSFLYPYVKDKSSWPFQEDVMYWEEWPVRQPSFLFGGMALNKTAYLDLWKSLEPHFDNPEVIRNMPIRYPLLWVRK